MARLAREGSKSIRIRSTAVELTRRLVQKDYVAEARTCLEYVRDRIRYVRDIYDVETLHHAETILETGSGDCDDKAILLAALLRSVGHPVRFIAISHVPGLYSHVWTQSLAYGRWIDLEATEPIEFGQSVPSQGVVGWLIEDI